MSKSKYWSGDALVATGADYMLAFGERSSGKSFWTMSRIIHNYIETGEQGAIIRRWKEDFIGKRGQVMFDAIVYAGLIEKWSDGAWKGVSYYASKWYLYTVDEDGKRILCEEPFCYGFALTDMMHDKSTAYPGVTTILFDEFIERAEAGYLADEFVTFCNVLSTIIRERTNVKIFMMGNTLNRYCPYFKELGLKHISDMAPGTLDVYTMGNGKLKIAVEYTSPVAAKEASNKYFCFDNPRLQMIRTGAWELDVYPHKPCKFETKDIRFMFFIIFDDKYYQCEVVKVKFGLFLYIHLKTGDIKNPYGDIVYAAVPDYRMNWRRNFTSRETELETKIMWFFDHGRVYYQDNEVGDAIANFIKTA